MNYAEAQKFIENTAKLGSRPGLSVIKELLNRLGNPQNQLKVIHVAGTNGKGSIFSFLESGLKQGGYCVGRYISPTIFSYLERFQINGEYMEEECFGEYVRIVQQKCEEMVADGYDPPTVFEVETAIAFLYFLQKKVDVVLLETGMGGSEDATNVVEKPLATVFSSISMDHMEFLGNTLEEIAANKAGIMREEVPVVLAPMQHAAEETLIKCAKKRNALVIKVAKPEIVSFDLHGTYFCCPDISSRIWNTTMLGDYQAENAATAIAVWKKLKDIFPMEEDKFADGISKCIWKGRFEVLQKNPYVIRDGAHNIDAVIRLKHNLIQYFQGKKIRFVLGIFKDKEHEAMLRQILPVASALYTVTPPNPKRAMTADQLAKEADHINKETKGHCNTIKAFTHTKDALEEAVNASSVEDAVVICGSLSFIGNILQK